MIVAALIVETSPPLPSSPVLHRAPLILAAMVTAIGSDPAPRVLLAINAMQLPPLGCWAWTWRRAPDPARCRFICRPGRC